ncbi:MAG: hypothetical protein AUK27_02315 [Deltaproteobacteria bacterium CG2_30_66_27]|nr:MAG: hypothetical protein AUK27_02315 [Deltaproteobacteria bacterium CG2_30_66_27]PJB32460.1 MAG: hypothetical protein CO109_04510 [Deltaproteobacteria bacterium CG_4_9_14_3_um_filter_65_9]
MHLRIDGCDVSLDLPAGSTFGAVLAEAGRKVASDGRVVSRIVADGREISTRFEREMADRPADRIDTVDITTTTPDALFREALDGAVDLSLAIRRDTVTILSSLRAGDLAAAGPRYATCVESLGTFFHLAGAVFNAIGTGVFPLAVRPGSAGELPSPPLATAGILQRLLRTQKGNDWNAVADILEREILPNIDGWSAFFKALKEIGAE